MKFVTILSLYLACKVFAEDASTSSRVVTPPEDSAATTTTSSGSDSADPISSDASCEEPTSNQTNAASSSDNLEDIVEEYEEIQDMVEEEEFEYEDEENEDIMEEQEEESGQELYFKVWDRTDYTLDEHKVAGINLADYGKEPLFQLFDDFDISSFIRGDEDWHEILAYRNGLTRPSLSFYVDKVARKRWLPTMGFPQPDVQLLSYAEELTETGDLEEETNVILEALPTTGSFCAKPTHMSLTKGAWLVDHDDDGVTRFSTRGKALKDHEGTYSAATVAESLAETLHDVADDIESWALKNVKPGLVVEERWADHEKPNAPPHEFNMFTIWGRVWVGQWNTVVEENRYFDGFIYRNGTMAHGSYYPVDQALPDWIPWDELVRIAERLGRNKDMFRTDIFVGRPASADPSSPLQIGVSESEIFPTTEFISDELSREGARLWLAGYVLGIYEIVENTEVPPEFLERGKLSDIMEYR